MGEVSAIGNLGKGEAFERQPGVRVIERLKYLRQRRIGDLRMSNHAARVDQLCQVVAISVYEAGGCLNKNQQACRQSAPFVDAQQQAFWNHNLARPVKL